MKAIKTLMMVSLTIFSLAVFAQDTTQQKSKMKTEQTNYSCPMHPEVTSDKPGKCSKCGMDLTQSKNKQIKMYTCPMHPNVTSDNPGKCSKCGMDLKEVQAIAYACPMKCEGDKTYDKSGKCPKCGMNLKEKTEQKNDHSDHKH